MILTRSTNHEDMVVPRMWRWGVTSHLTSFSNNGEYPSQILSEPRE
jgi:hypothetical protein